MVVCNGLATHWQVFWFSQVHALVNVWPSTVSGHVVHCARTYAAKEKRRNVIEDCIFARGLQIRSLFQQASLSVVSNDETSSAFTRGNSNDTLGDFIRV
ncbi:hypothetical protein EDD16DRAFT_1593171, partial [Pisolithus croceorrhizus]